MDKHYWKDAYKGLWSESAAKEKKVAALIQEATGLTVVEIGLGAGEARFISGNAQDNQYQKGDADLHIPAIDTYVEVTGPNIPMKEMAPLWVRPDKLHNSYEKLQNQQGRLHVLVHVITLPDNRSLLRAIILDDNFFETFLKRGHFATVFPVIRGKKEKYIEIPANHKTVIQWAEFLRKLPPC